MSYERREVMLYRVSSGHSSTWTNINEQYSVVTQELIGEGPCWRCFRGELDGRYVAVKAPIGTLDAAAFAELRKELQLLASISAHDNVVQFIGAILDCKARSWCHSYLTIGA